MSALPEVPREEVYTSLYEKAQKESSDLKVQLTTMEILATKLRDQRDEATQREEAQKSVIEHLEGVIREMEERDSQPQEVIEGDIVE